MTWNRKARAERPKLIIAGGSAYPRTIDFARIRKVADEVGAFFMVDMAHFAGLVAAGLFPSPLPDAHVVTTTTHKTLRGPRGGMVLSNSEDIGKKINSAVFPGLQGGPLMHVIAGKAVAFHEALQPGFRTYQQAVLDNARALAATLQQEGLAIVTGGTDCHLVLVDLRPKHVTGKAAEASLERAGITANKNAIPFDPEKPAITSGIRLGSPAATTRGFGVPEFQDVGRMIGTCSTASPAPTTAPTTPPNAKSAPASATSAPASPSTRHERDRARPKVRARESRSLIKCTARSAATRTPR